MNSANPIAWWRAFLALPNAHPAKTLGVALLVALACSLVVSVAAVTLRPLQEANRLRESAAAMVAMLDRLGAGLPQERLVDLASGEYVARDPGTMTELSAKRDPAKLGSREDVARVYELREGGRLTLLVLPLRGAGYEDMMRGYLVLRSDLNTVAALAFHEHHETPGMGARIGEETWQALWPGKLLADERGKLRIEVVKEGASGPHEVDGISGATRTGTAITRLLQFWLGPDGYGPYLARLKAEAGQ